MRAGCIGCPSDALGRPRRSIERRPRHAVRQFPRQRRAAIAHRCVDLSFSSYGAASDFFKLDPLHFRPEAGAQMLNAEVIPVALRIVSSGTALQSSKVTAAPLGDARN